MARGASRFTFKPAGTNVSQEKWNKIFGVSDKDAGGRKRKKIKTQKKSGRHHVRGSHKGPVQHNPKQDSRSPCSRRSISKGGWVVWVKTGLKVSVFPSKHLEGGWVVWVNGIIKTSYYGPLAHMKATKYAERVANGEVDPDASDPDDESVPSDQEA